MAFLSLQTIADDIRTLEEAGLLDIASLNKHLWPLAEICLLGTPSEIQHTERGRQSSIAENPTPSPHLAPAQSGFIGTSRNNAARRTRKGDEAISTDSGWTCGSAIPRGGTAHHRTSESSDEGIGQDETDTASENNQNNMQCGALDNVVLEERLSARFAAHGKMMAEGQQPAVFAVGQGREKMEKVKQSINNTRDGRTVKYGLRHSSVGSVGGKASRNQTSTRDQSEDEKRANERLEPSTSYPESLMVQPSTCASDESKRGTKRVTSDDELQPAHAKRTRTLSTELEPGLPRTSPSPQFCADLLPKRQQHAEDVENLRSQFRSRWAEKLPTFDAWQKMDRFSIIGARPNQEPYVEVEVIMQRVLSIGTLKVQANFARSVTAWMASPHITKCAPEPPAHLESIPGFEAEPFQRFWKAMEVSRCAKGVEDMAILLRRKSLVDLISAYNEVVKHVRLCAGSGKLKLRSGETAGAKAREIVYSILYPEAETRKKMRSSFNYDQQCASAYVKLEKHFGNIGILAMIPTKLNEMDLRSTDARFAAFMELLDIVRPELRGPRVKFYAGIIETIAGGGLPDASTLQELAVWTSTKSSLRSPSSTEQALSAPIDTVIESM